MQRGVHIYFGTFSVSFSDPSTPLLLANEIELSGRKKDTLRSFAF
jgi:hypothetical protein